MGLHDFIFIIILIIEIFVLINLIMEKNKIKNIEFLRFIFAIIIIHSHILWLLIGVYKICPGFSPYIHLYSPDGFLCVEYFFIISGFFLYKHCLRKNDSTINYTVEKIKRLYPLFLFSFLLIYLTSIFIPINLYNYSNFLNLLMLNFTVVKTGSNNGYSWFINVLFLVSIFFHYLYRNYNKKTVNLFIFITVIISYTLLLNKSGGSIPGRERDVFYILQGSVLRGLGGLGIGCIIGLFTEKLSDFINNFKPKFPSFCIISFLEIYFLLFIFNNSIFHKISYQNDFIFIAIFSILFVLFIARKGFLSKLLDNNISVYLGAFSYSIYIMQAVGFYISKYYFWDNKAFIYAHPYINLSISLSVCILIGIISHLIINKILNYITSYQSSNFIHN